ncbi:ferredoxin--nitrite reductase [Paenibacillus baekrokdamisoli]|uniref:Ferredoxin--nitrite reductase n=1 Tax=Paenibacillus baekrokdamisoli TaxID=1712516 RepID=A0A3G9IU59_9BACL|nr:nitrite/sulfite reductase [Paenibacillus baekrokdamisoli]MBB3071699.1 ferredoxin-nitrite reductase [Paenibacillus baekrokdamisoli]BBH21792.1 ferredoxin--nitrite reductase [Paenibacillus baekrokdamisoli]
MAYEAIWANEPSKLNAAEFMKMEKDGLDVIRTIIETYSVEGYESIPADELNRFKWAGVYQQKPNDGHFMMRIRIPSGMLTAAQARALADISTNYGRNLMDVTTRQSIQFHWLRVEQLPDIFKRLDAVGLYSFEACGDCPRAIVGNPLAGIDKYELFDTTEIVQQVSDFFVMNRDFSNLPRKYKISISSNIYNNGFAEIQDLGFTPAVKMIDGKEVQGFHIQVGGGLSAKPFLAQPLNAFVHQENVLKVAIGVTTIFRDYGYREKRHHARMKFLVNDWGPEKFFEKLTELIGPLPERGEDKTIGWQSAYYDGIGEQKQEGLRYLALNVPVGRLSGTDLAELARISETYGDGSIRTTISQNIIIPNIPADRVSEAVTHDIFRKLSPNRTRFLDRTVSCTGNEFCNLAIVETKLRAQSVAEYLEVHVDIDEDIRIHFVGCPNACGQKQIADIGLQGSLVKTSAGMQEAFDIAIGGILGPNAQFNEKLKGRVVGEQVGPVLADLIHYYKETRATGETFHQFYKRVGIGAFQLRLNAVLSSITEQEVNK